MALQSTGPISINNIVNELGATGSGYGAISNSIGLQNPQTTTHQNASVDDNFVTISLGFNIIYNGTTYNTVYVGSNSYITFGGGASDYSGLSAATTPARPTIKMSAADNSYQKVTSGSPLGAGTKTIRFEGTASTAGTVFGPNMVWEITFYSGSSQFNVAWGVNTRSTSGTGGMTNGSTYLYQNDTVFCGTNVSYMIVTAPLSNISLNKLEVTPSFYNVSINQNSTSKPNGANPNKISEWYSYNNAAVQGTLRILYRMSLGDLRWSNIYNAVVSQPGNPGLDGVTNCNAIISQSGHTSSGALSCLNLNADGYSDWYLGAWGENLRIFSNKTAINQTISTIGGDPIISIGDLMSSTQVISIADEFLSISLVNGNPRGYKKYWLSTVRPIRKEVVSDTSIYNIGDHAFGGIVFEIM